MGLVGQCKPRPRDKLLKAINHRRLPVVEMVKLMVPGRRSIPMGEKSGAKDGQFVAARFVVVAPLTKHSLIKIMLSMYLGDRPIP